MAHQFFGTPDHHLTSEKFFGTLASITSQSTPKADHHFSAAMVSDDGNISGVTHQDESIDQQSEDSGFSVSKSLTRIPPVSSAVEEVVLQSPSNSRVEDIVKRTQDLIERFNEKRAMDQHVMNSFEEKLIKKVGEICLQVKKTMHDYYEEYNEKLQVNVTELSEVLERSSQLSMELQEVSQTLEAINKGLQHDTEE